MKTSAEVGVALTSHTVQLDALQLRYRVAGEGPVLVLLHGFPETWWSWRYQIEPLVRAGYRVVAPDQRGYGESSKAGPYDLDTLAGDVAKLIDQVSPGEPVTVIGHDWGGGVAWHVASFHPSKVRRLVVLNCPHLELMRRALLTRPSLRQLKRSWYFFFFLLPGLPEWALRRRGAGAVVAMVRAASVDRAHFSAAELQPFREALLQPGAANAMVGWYRAAVWTALRKPPAYPRLTLPTLLIWGMQDPALGFDDVVPGTEAFVERLELERIEACGHFVHAERPAEVNRALLSFLAKTATGS